VIDYLRARSLFQADNVSQRHQAVGIRTHVVLAQVARIHAEWLIGLHVDAVRPIIEVEIIHVLRAHIDAQRLRDLINRHADGFCLFAINLHQLLRIVCSEASKQSAQVGALVTGSHDLVRNRVDVLQGVASQVLQLELETAEAPNTLNCRRLKRHHDRARDAEKLWRNPCHNIAGCVPFTFAIVDRLQRREDQTVVR
jgi:hypothetical protein